MLQPSKEACVLH